MKKKINFTSVILASIIYFIILFFLNDPGNHLKEIRYVSILAIPCIMVFISSLTESDEKTKKSYLYLYLLAYLVILIGFVFSNARGNSLSNTGIFHYDFNLIPFSSIKELINDELGPKFYLYNIAGNFLMLTPLAVILPLLNDKFKKAKFFIPLVILLSLIIEVIQYTFNIGSFDIDDIILNALGASILYLIISKTNLKNIINNIFLNIKLKKNKYLDISYIILLSISSLVLIYNTYRIINSVLNSYVKYDLSSLKCINNEETYLLDYDNYHYYSSCNYGDSGITIKKYNHESLYSLTDFIKLGYLNYLNNNMKNDLKLKKKEIITNIVVNENKTNTKILINSVNSVDVYYYNIDSIIIYQDGKEYNHYEYIKNYKEGQELKIDLSPLGKIEYFEPNHKYTISATKYYRELSCFKEKYANDSQVYYVPLSYKITENSCDELSKVKISNFK